ncbi:6641_t:CDS:2 [Funneliformis geosporum]|uniref:6641_t:CDS:1 n=1 Tax=Funneliformis geosporum TaxID=1117311 RepID=A0A9W4SQB8_9GLOM|nr:6641_t:CDS:2 [Funneliformis geosporum]
MYNNVQLLSEETQCLLAEKRVTRQTICDLKPKEFSDMNQDLIMDNILNLIDFDESVESNGYHLFLKSSEENFSLAQVYLAQCFNDGHGIEQNHDLAFKWYQKAAECESTIGQFYLGNCYEHGIGIKNNLEKAFYWYKKSAKNENQFAQYSLGTFYEIGTSTERDVIKAFEFYNYSANQGYLDAQYKVAYCYDKGIGIEINKEKAFELYEEAADKGNIFAQYNLGERYERIGIDTNKEKAFELYKDAAEKGDNCAQYNLEVKETEQNLEKHFYHIQKAMANENKLAKFSLDLYYDYDNNVEAFESYEKSAKYGFINAQFKVAFCCNKGFGTEINKERAFELYKSLAKEKEIENSTSTYD